MQEYRVVISRVITSPRFAPVITKSKQERISDFAETQQMLSVFPFSADYATKAAMGGGKRGGAGRTSASADNKDKRKKESNFKRIGIYCYDPKATRQENQYFETRPRFNLDGQMGDVANVGWLDRPKTVKPEKFLDATKKKLLQDAHKPKIIARNAEINKRTGEIKVKALGPSIGSAAGSIGQAAARAVGIVLDPSGRMRCPPGVPAANQFTDEIGSNCFDFTPAIGRAVIDFVKNAVQKALDDVREIDSAVPVISDGKGGIARVPRQTRARVAQGLASSSGRPRDSGILGPDGEVITSPEFERDIAELTATAIPISPDDYPEVFEALIRQAFPDKSEAEIKRLTKTAVIRQQLKDKTRSDIEGFLAMAKDLGVDIDPNNAESVQDGISKVFGILQSPEGGGWGINLRDYYGANPRDKNFDRKMLEHKKRQLDTVLLYLEQKPQIIGLTNSQWKNFLENDYDGDLKKLREDIIEVAAGRKEISDVFPPGSLGEQIFDKVVKKYQALQAQEAGMFIGLINQRRNFPELTSKMRDLVYLAPDDVNHGNDDAATFANVKEGGFDVGINPLRVLDHTDAMNKREKVANRGGGFTLFEPDGVVGTEVAKLQAIATSIDREGALRVREEYFNETMNLANMQDRIDKGDDYQQFFIARTQGAIGQSIYIMNHEMIHARQIVLVENYLRSIPGLVDGKTTSEMMELVMGLIGGEITMQSSFSRDWDYASIIGNSDWLVGALDNLPEVLQVLLGKNAGGAYVMGHYYTAAFMAPFVHGDFRGDTKQLFIPLQKLNLELIDMAARGEQNSTKYRAALEVYEQVASIYETDSSEKMEELVKSFKSRLALTIAEMQAEIGAAVEAGFLKRTPEIDAFLGPISASTDITSDFGKVNPDAKPVIDIRKDVIKESIKGSIRKSIKRRKNKRELDAIPDGTILDPTLIKIPDGSMVELPDGTFVDADSLGEIDSELYKVTMGFSSRTELSKMGSTVHDSIMDTATSQQKQIIDGNWRDAKWNTSDPVDWSRALQSRPDEVVNSIENQLIPFIDLIDSSEMPTDVVAEVHLPSNIISDDLSANISVDKHFTAVMHSADDISSPDIDSENSVQRLMILVPEGAKGLPDKTPGTNGGEIGSIILPPGQIEIIGRRTDGVALGKIVSQKDTNEQLSELKQILHSLGSNESRPLNQRIIAKRSENRIERHQELTSGPRAQVAVAMELDSRNSLIAQKLEYDPQTRTLKVSYRNGQTREFENVPYGRVRDAGATNKPDKLIRELEESPKAYVSSKRTTRTGLSSRTSTAMEYIGSASMPDDDESIDMLWQGYLASLRIDAQEERLLVRTESVEEAVIALLDGHDVDMPDIEGAHTLIEDLAKMIVTLEEMFEAGEIDESALKNFVFDLCQVTVQGTSAFCLGNKGIPRFMMPQAAGQVVPGSAAERLLEKQNAERLAKGEKISDEVEGTEDFLAYLLEKGGITAGKPERVRSDKLKATQRDMQGHKVAGMMGAKKAGKYDPSKKPIFVSSDGYVVDGHHRWAATLAMDFQDGILGNDHLMNVIVLDAPISQILRLANEWTDEFGISKKPVAKRSDVDPDFSSSVVRQVRARAGLASSSSLAQDNLSVEQERATNARERVDSLEKALDILEKTGEWRGEEFGVTVGSDISATDLDVFDDGTPTNLSKEDIEKRFGDVKEFTFLVRKKLRHSEKENDRAQYSAKSKQVRAEQGTLDIEDLTPEQFKELLEENKILTSADFDGAAVHAGQSELDGGVLDPSRTVGGTEESVAAGGGAGDTGNLNLSQIAKQREQLAAAEESTRIHKRIEQAFIDNKTTLKPESEYEADLLNQFFTLDTRRNSSQRQFKIGEEFDITKFYEKIDRVKELVNSKVADNDTTIKSTSELLAAMEDGGKYGFLSAQSAEMEFITQGYFGRNAGSVVPKNVATHMTEFESSKFGGDGRRDFKEVKDPEMLGRWRASLRGTTYLVTDKKKITSNLGPDGERQILGKTKPVFAVSALVSPTGKFEERGDWGKVARALMARAIRLEKEGKEVNIENVLAARRGEPLPDAPKLTRAGGLKSTTSTAEILSRANEKGIDIDSWEREQMPRIGGKRVWRMTGSDALASDGIGEKLKNAFAEAKVKGDDKKADLLKKLYQDVRNMTEEELALAVEDALKRLPPLFGKNVSVQVSDPLGIIKRGRYLTVHEQEKMKAAGLKGLSERDRFDIETIIRARSNTEGMFLKFSPKDTSPATEELRPASGFVTSTMSEQRRASSLSARYGKDVEIQHPYAVGEAAKKDNQDMARYGTSRIILRPEVAERSLVFKGDSIQTTDNSPALKLSTIDESPYRGMWFNPVSILYADRTGDMESIFSPGANLPKNGRKEPTYQEAMVLGSFGNSDIAAMVISPADIRKGYDKVSNPGFNIKFNGNVTSLIATAQLRDELANKDIDVVMDSSEFPLDEVEPFNAAMTRQWVQERMDDGKSWETKITLDELVPDEETTPYEAFLRYTKITKGVGSEPRLGALFDHPDNEPDNLKKNQINLNKMIDAELERIEAVKAKQKDKPQRSGGLSSRTTREKVNTGPSVLAFGRASDGTPVVADIETSKKKFGSTKKSVEDYFSKTHGIKVKAPNAAFKNTREGNRAQQSVMYGAIQGLDDVLNNLDIRGLTGRDDLQINFETFEFGDSAMGSFSPNQKWWSRTKLGDNKTKSTIEINLSRISGGSDPRKVVELNFAREWKETMNDPRQILNITNLFAQFNIPNGFEIDYPGDDSPQLGEWNRVSELIRQRLGYAVVVHELGHYLDFSQREDNDFSLPSMMGTLLRGGELSAADEVMTDRIAGEIYASSKPSPSFTDAASTSAYGLTNSQEKIAEGFLSWFTLMGSKKSSLPIDGTIVNGGISDMRTREAATFRQTVEDTVTELLDKLGPRVKSEEIPTKKTRTSTTSSLPISALLFAVLPFVEKLNSMQSTSGKMGRRRIRRIAGSTQKNKEAAHS